MYWMLPYICEQIAFTGTCSLLYLVSIMLLILLVFLNFFHICFGWIELLNCALSLISWNWKNGGIEFLDYSTLVVHNIISYEIWRGDETCTVWGINLIVFYFPFFPCCMLIKLSLQITLSFAVILILTIKAAPNCNATFPHTF